MGHYVCYPVPKEQERTVSYGLQNGLGEGSRGGLRQSGQFLLLRRQHVGSPAGAGGNRIKRPPQIGSAAAPTCLFYRRQTLVVNAKTPSKKDFSFFHEVPAESLCALPIVRTGAGCYIIIRKGDTDVQVRNLRLKANKHESNQQKERLN